MVDVIIKDVPDGCEDNVKSMAMVAIERFIKARDLKEDKSKIEKFRKDIDDIYISNSLDKKYDKSEELPK